MSDDINFKEFPSKNGRALANVLSNDMSKLDKHCCSYMLMIN